MNASVLWLHEIGMADHDQVGGKNSSLGEMIRELSAAQVSVPGGYATSAAAFERYLAQGALDQRIAARLVDLNVDDTHALAAAGAEIRAWIMATPLTATLESAIRAAYRKLSADSGQ
ncbi:phosphoenolpyruvate synthase, partial [mine drainage metagenome]